jgi:hypothetical protein
MNLDLVPGQIRIFLGAAFPLRTTLPGQIHALRMLLLRWDAVKDCHEVAPHICGELRRACAPLAAMGPGVPGEEDGSLQAMARRVELLAQVLEIAVKLQEEEPIRATPHGAPRRVLGQVPDLSGQDREAGEGMGKLLPLRRIARHFGGTGSPQGGAA